MGMEPSWSSAKDNFYNLMFPLFQGGSKYNLALIDQTVLEKMMYENDGHIHVYSPGAEADNHLRSFFSKRLIFCQFGHLLQVFPVK